MAEDVRIFKTKQNIQAAFIKLLGKKDFDSITIKNICEASLTSRSTFYSHYTDKYDLLEKVVQYYVDIVKKKAKLRFLQTESGGVEKIIGDVSQIFSHRKEEIKTLLKVHVPRGDLREEIEKILFSQCRLYLQQHKKSTDVSLDLLANLYVANVFVLMTWILENGMDKKAINLLNRLQYYFFTQMSL
ncbi:TetR/AcrR family transcriptional regulator [Clostridium sp. MT-14]|uniref:TetR/AcrR family transcriptional regulator n=1 Tax=Clostridium TaxID=1485 RepID=UPI000D028D51|nr:MULTISPECIES: TetR family transcriptional regulator [Clostridium]KAA8680162.1 TetR/AcrR family transcriptional regulator [Clostridium sp. HV4-5-A1G]CAB1244170.1 TetR family regulatory protein [Clostridiaceae bacterium BL-3]